jgi:hypothetical protein
MYYYLATLVVLSYVLMQSIETISFGSRVASRLCNKAALGTTLQNSIFIGSRLFLVPMLLSLAYLIESGIRIQTYLTMVIASTVLSFFLSLVVLSRLDFFQKIFQKIFFFYSESTIPIAILKTFKSKRRKDIDLVDYIYEPNIHNLIWKKVLVSSLAYIFLSTGFFLAFMLAIIFPEYRLTLGQLSTVFHGIGAVLLAFYIDPMLSRSIDDTADNEVWRCNVYSVFIGRVLSYLFSTVILLFLGFLYT